MYSRKHYLSVLKEAEDSLAQLDLMRARACGFGVRKVEGGGEGFTFECLGKLYTISADAREVRSADGRPMPLIMRVVVLHYLLRGGAAGFAGEYAPLKDMPGLELYACVIQRRSEDVLARAFGPAPELLKPAAARLGGLPVSMGDAAARLFPLPKIPMVVFVNGPLEEIPANAGTLFDRSAPELLPLEDLVVLAEIVSHKLVNNIK
jgi:hypothetical protein